MLRALLWEAVEAQQQRMEEVKGGGELGPLCGTHFWGSDPFLRGDVPVGRICGWRSDGGGTDLEGGPFH